MTEVSQRDSALERLFARLSRHASLSQGDRNGLARLVTDSTRLRPGEHLIRQGEAVEHCALVTAGFASRHRTASGGRQILSIHMAGELLDLQNLLSPHADHNVSALSLLDLELLPRSGLLELTFSSPALARALWAETLIESSIVREWLVNVGRRDSSTRVAHFLAELGIRWEAAGLGERLRFELPLTQEQLADCLQLTVFYANKMLRSLEDEELIRRDRRWIHVVDWQSLCRKGEFEPGYLHLEGLPG